LNAPNILNYVSKWEDNILTEMGGGQKWKKIGVTTPELGCLE